MAVFLTLLQEQVVGSSCSSSTRQFPRNQMQRLFMINPDTEYIYMGQRIKFHYRIQHFSMAMCCCVILYSPRMSQYIIRMESSFLMGHPSSQDQGRGTPGGRSFLTNNGALVGDTKCCSSFNILVKTWQLFFPFNTRKNSCQSQCESYIINIQYSNSYGF